MDAEAISASPDGKWLAEAGRDQRIRIRDAASLRVVAEFWAHDATVRDVAWHRDLPLLASVSEDLSIRIWNTVSWKQEEEIRGFEERPDGIFFSPYSSEIGLVTRKAWKASLWESKAVKRFSP